MSLYYRSYLIFLYFSLLLTIATRSQIAPFTRQSLKNALCMKARIKVNHKTGSSKVEFKLLNSIHDDNRFDAIKQNPGVSKKKKCDPQAKCGYIFFPHEKEHVLEELLQNLYDDSILHDGKIKMAFGSSGRMAKALMKGAEISSKKNSKHKPSAYMIRRAIPETDEKAFRKNQIMNFLGLQKEGATKTPSSVSVVSTAQEKFDEIVRPLISLDPKTSSILDNVELLLSEINDLCNTKYYTRRQVLSSTLLEEIYIDEISSTDNKKSIELVDSNAMATIPNKEFNPEYAKELISLGASCNIRGKNGVTPLMTASSEGDHLRVSRLIQFGALVNLRDIHDATALHHALADTNLDLEFHMIQDLALSCNIQATDELISCIHAKDTAGRTPFMRVLERGANIFYFDRPKPNILIVISKILLELGSDINTYNYLGQTPLMLASQRKLYMFVQFLISNGANIEIRDTNNVTALWYSIEWYSWAVTFAKKIVHIKSSNVTEDLYKLFDLHAFDDIHTSCFKNISKYVYNNKVPYLKPEISLNAITKSLIKCQFLDRSFHLLLKSNASLNIIDTKGNTILHNMHPNMINSKMNTLLNNKQKLDLSILLNHQNYDGLLWNQSLYRMFVDDIKDNEEYVINSYKRIDNNNDAVNYNNGENVDDENVNLEKIDCDFDVINYNELKLKNTKSNLTYFEHNYHRWNKPVLILNYTNSGKWDQVKDAWTNEEWINSNYGDNDIVTGNIPYPTLFNSISHRRKMRSYLIQIKEYEKARKKLIIDRTDRDISMLSRPPMYYFEQAVLLSPSNGMVTRLANMFIHKKPFSTCLHKENKAILQSAQFYYGHYNSGAPFHFHNNALNVLFQGTKDWLFTPPRYSMYSRLHPTLWKKTMNELRKENNPKKYFKCTQPSNSLIYVPVGWSHAVLNKDQNVPSIGVAVEYASTSNNEDFYNEFTQRVQNSTKFARDAEFTDYALMWQH